MKCSICYDLAPSGDEDQHEETLVDSRVPFQGTARSREAQFTALCASAAAGCVSCGIIHDGIVAMLGENTFGVIEMSKHLLKKDGEMRHTYPFGVFVEVSHEHRVQIDFYTDNEDISKRWPLIPIAPHISYDSSSDVCLEQARFWLDHCRATHSDCSSGFTGATSTSLLPSRVIVTGNSSQLPYLYETAPGETGLYAALSYCWGKSRAFTTTKSTFEDRKAGFALSFLPKTCRDAILVARSLHIPFLWIDSLCIIQDSNEDWEREAAKMCDVYSNAVVTLAGLDSPDSETGLFLSNPERNKVALVCTLEDGKPGNVYVRRHYRRLKLGFLHANHTEAHNVDSGGVLQTRGWTLQELTLSPRILWFSSWELGWSCRMETACECEPIPTADLMKRGVNSLTTIPRKDGQADWATMWNGFVQVFTRRSLTKQTDRLPALAGIAAAMSERIGGRFFAGLWETELEKGLLWLSNWFVLSADERPPQLSPIESDYAPSWTWASVGGPIWFVSMVIKPRYRVLWKIVDVNFAPTTTNPFGPGRGILTIEALTLHLQISDDGYFVHLSQGRTFYFSNTAESWFPDRIDPHDLDSLTSMDLYFAFAGLTRKTTKSGKESCIDFVGLVLERFGDGSHRRIGLIENKFDRDDCEGTWDDWQAVGKKESIRIV